jgi:antitoxin component HigA of HigAB toxin-antitoxin module
MMDVRPLHSEVVFRGRKRPLTMEMAWKLNRQWGIPAECLIRPARETTP